MTTRDLSLMNLILRTPRKLRRLISPRKKWLISSWQRKVTGKNELLMLEEPDGSSFFVVLF